MSCLRNAKRGEGSAAFGGEPPLAAEKTFNFQPATRLVRVAGLLRVVAGKIESVTTNFAKDFEDFDPKTAISANVYGHVAGAKVGLDQCLCGLLRVLRVFTPKGGPPSAAG